MKWTYIERDGTTVKAKSIRTLVKELNPFNAFRVTFFDFFGIIYVYGDDQLMGVVGLTCDL